MKHTEDRVRPARNAEADGMPLLGAAPHEEPRRTLGLARAVLAWEWLWPALWPAAGVTGLFLALALFNVLPDLGGPLHLAVLLLFAAALATALWRGLRPWRLPDLGAARRRLERDNDLAHRPLHALRDTLADSHPDPTTAALWRLHQERIRQRMRSLRVRLPHPNLAARDRRGLRAAVGLILFIAAAGTWNDWRPRLAAALSPRFEAAGSAAPVALDLWVTPPQYTGLAPVFLKGKGGGKGQAAAAAAGPDGAAGSDEPIVIPVGSALLARVAGGSALPVLRANGIGVTFSRVDATTAQISQAIESGDRIAVEQGGRVLGSWPITVVPDRAPTIALTQPPGTTERAALRLDFTASDDYGLVSAAAVVRLDAEAAPAEGALDRTPIELPLSLPGLRPKQARGAAWHDLTPHPWAGLPVRLRLLATDAAGQTGSSEEVAAVLPERVFNHPVARAIVAERRKLTLHPRTAREEVAQALSGLSVRPGLFHDDIVVFLALRTTVARLALDDSDRAVPAIQQLLWDTALRLEDRGLSLAERDLRNAEKALKEALDRNAPDAEVGKLMNELQSALDRFLDAMEQNLREQLARGETPREIPPELAQQMQMVDREDLQRMLDQIRDMTQTGSRDAARQMLSQLQQMLENMRSGMTAQGGQDQNPAWDLMRDLQQMTRQQQQLLDKTFRQAQNQDQNQTPEGMEPDGQAPSPGPVMPGQRSGRQAPGRTPAAPSVQATQEQQEALRRQLGELMRRMGEMAGDIPRPLGRAERAMRDAEQALGRGAPGAAVKPQTQALDALQQGLQSFAQQMMEQAMGMGQMPGQRGPFRQGRNRDPLGRMLPNVGSMDGNDVQIPEQSDLQRAREILDELRRRAGQYDRPKLERDYIDRLLKQF